MERTMKFHIYNYNSEPFCWENDKWDCDKAIEFDTEEAANEFLYLLSEYYPEVYEECGGIKKDILFYDGGYIHGALALELMKIELRQRGIELDD